MNDLDEYKTVLIIGNGFDLNIKMHTSYSDFMKSKYFESLLSEKNSLASNLNNRRKCDSNWIDIEKELGNYARVLADYNVYEIPREVRYNRDLSDMDKAFRAEFTSLCDALKRYLKEIEDLSKLDSNIECTFAYNLIRELVLERKSCYVVNFNYTYFVERVIEAANCNYNTGFKIRQIHGSLKKNIVFGVQDSLNLNREHVFLYKSHNKNQDVKGVPQILENANKIIFFGYSLGETDHSYFSDFFETQTRPQCHSKTIKFYYYGQDAYDDIIWQLKTLTNNRTSYLNQYNNIQFEDSSRISK